MVALVARFNRHSSSSTTQPGHCCVLAQSAGRAPRAREIEPGGAPRHVVLHALHESSVHAAAGGTEHASARAPGVERSRRFRTMQSAAVWSTALLCLLVVAFSGAAAGRELAPRKRVMPKKRASDWLSESSKLHQAAWLGNLEDLQAEIAAGAEVNGREKTADRTPLHFAAYSGKNGGKPSAELVEALLAAGADVNAVDST